MRLTIIALLATLSISASAYEVKQPVLKGIIKTEVHATQEEALVTAFEIEDQLVAGENEVGLKQAKIGCATYTKNVAFTKGQVRLDTAYVNGEAQHKAVIYFNYTCNFLKK